MPSTNQCIGSHYDELKHRVFYFNYNSDGYNGIYVYNLKTNNIEPLLISYVDSQEDLFDFDPKYPVASVNILYRTEQDGDIIHWTDRKNRPMKVNIKDTGLDRPAGVSRTAANVYGTNWKKEYLTVSRKVPGLAPVCNYATEPSSTSNNLASKLFQFSYRWVYRDDTKSTWGPWSALVPPAGVTDTTLSTAATNNVINVFYKTGQRDVTKIEISVRESVASVFSDRMLATVIDKVKNSIPDNSTNVYNFYNDQLYSPVGMSDSIQLFDYVPKKANTQELLNGNVLAYGGITEGNTFSETLSISKTIDTVKPTNPLVVTGKSNGSAWSFTFGGIPVVGDSVAMTVDLYVVTTGSGGFPSATSKKFNYSYTVGTGDTLSTVINYFSNIVNNESDLNTSSITNGFNISYYTNNVIRWSVTGTATVTLINPGAIPDTNISIYKHSSLYKFGLVYFDEFGVTNGVVTNTDMRFMTPSLSVANLGSGTDPIIPYPRVKFSISHKPPSWAKSFSFVRTKNLTNSNFVWATTNGIYKDSTYAYMNILTHNENNAGFPAYQYTKGDRVIIHGAFGQSTYNGYEVPIIDVLPESTDGTKTLGYWIKIQYDNTSAFMTTWPANPSNSTVYYIEPYRPFTNSSFSDQVYYEFGENYNIITDANGNLAHEGSLKNQVIQNSGQPTAAQAAEYYLYKGDVYSRLRSNGHMVIDMSISDKYSSKLDGNGRVFVEDEYARETYYPTTIRYSLEYQSSTSINNTNKFLAENLDEYDRQKGDIQRFKLKDNQLRVFQSRACGVVPILQNLLQTADGNSVVSQSSEIINKIQYYKGEYGIGEQYCSLASSPIADYFVDPVLGSQIRLSNDGITSISEIYKAHFFLTDKIGNYQKTDYPDKFGNGGYAKILGIYDLFEEEYVTVMQGSSTVLTDYTFGFSETRNAYSAFYDYSPEWIESAGNLLITWKNGELWTHNNTSTYANFYGTQYSPSIKIVFNENQNVKKHYNTITTLGNTTWVAPNQGDVNTNMAQQSQLVQSDFRIKDDKYHAAFKRDMLSPGGLLNGRPLKGSWVELNLRPVNPQSLVDLYYVELGIQQPLNNR